MEARSLVNSRAFSHHLTPRRRPAPLLALLLLITRTFPIAAFDEAIAGTATVVAVSADDAGSDTVRRVILSSIVLYLEQEGIIPIESSERELTDDLDRRVLRQSSSVGAEFALQAIATLGRGEVTVDISLFLVETGELLSRAQSTEEVGLTLDRAIAGLTGNVLQQARPFLEAAAAERRTEEAPPPERDGVFGDGTDLVRAPSGSAGQTVVTPGSGRTTTIQVPDRILAATVLFAPMIPVGTTASYFGIGYAGTLAVTAVPFERDTIGFGMTARAVLSQATGAATTAQALLVPIGLSARFSSDPTPIATHLRVTFGGAVFQLRAGSQGDFTKIAPYAGAELGMRMEFGNVGLVGAVSFEAYLDSIQPFTLLLGFAPGVGISLAL